MRTAVIAHVTALARGHADMARALPDEAFGKKLNAASNTIGEQFWCVVGARESYTVAIVRGEWAGFNCSLPGSQTDQKARVVAALDRSAQEFDSVGPNVEWADSRDELLLALLEHEAQHQGQLIRYVYALGYRFPDSWVSRWALSR